MNSELQKCRKYYDGLSDYIKSREMAVRFLTAIQIAENLEQAAGDVLAGFDAGVFVRNTNEDGKPDWAVKALPHIAAIGKLSALACVTKPEGES